jgi:hypothetical protein
MIRESIIKVGINLRHGHVLAENASSHGVVYFDKGNIEEDAKKIKSMKFSTEGVNLFNNGFNKN